MCKLVHTNNLESACHIESSYEMISISIIARAKSNEGKQKTESREKAKSKEEMTQA